MNKLSQMICNSFSIILLMANYSVAQNAVMLENLDIPLMEGMIENPDVAMVFDSPEGRIINAEAIGNVSVQDTYSYYMVVLPSLSWVIVNDQNSMECEENMSYCLRAQREQEFLTLQLGKRGGQAVINFSLAPE